MLAKRVRLPGGVMTLVHTQYHTELRVIPTNPGEQIFVKQYDYASALQAERDFDILARVALPEEESTEPA